MTSIDRMPDDEGRELAPEQGRVSFDFDPATQDVVTEQESAQATSRST